MKSAVVPRRMLSWINIRWFGTAAMLAGIAFVTLKLYEQGNLITQWNPSGRQIILILFACLIYGMANNLLAVGWWKLLSCFGGKFRSKREMYIIYAKAHIAKYIPGNIFHYVTRQLRGRLEGVDDRQLVAASFYEGIYLIISAAMIALAGWSYLRQEKMSGLFIAALLVAVYSLMLPKIVAVLSKRYAWIGRTWIRNAIVDVSYARMLKAFVLYAGFILITCLLFFLCIAVVLGRIDWPIFLHAVPVFAYSWVAGFITPGAPGGLGVREAIIVLMLSPYLPQASCVMIAVLYRIITMSGDLLFYANGHAVNIIGGGRHEASCVEQ